MTNFDTAYQQLNQNQRLAVDTIEGPVMVLAGPGTGKTQTLALRIANILRLTDTDPRSILALTFTDAGARAMQMRLISLIGPAAYYLEISTFHSFCSSVIRENPEFFPISPSREPISALKANKIISELLNTLPLTKLRPLGSPGHYINAILKAISDLKKEGFTPESFQSLLAKETMIFEQTKDTLTKSEFLKRERDLAKNQELALVFASYEEFLRKNGDYDFDDIISFVQRAFANNTDLLLSYQERYHYFLVDEYQDTNTSQNSVVDLLASYWGENSNIFVVGDPNQCIMRFQGASLENILAFRQKYPKAKIISLSDNYRSGSLILSAAHALINHNNPSSSPLFAATKTEGSLQYLTFQNNAEELHYLAQQIQALLNQQVPHREIAIIYRNNKEAKELGEVLDAYGIPYLINKGGNVLEDPLIRQLIKLLSLLVELRTKTDDLTLFTTLHYPYFGIDSLDILRLARFAASSKMGLWDVLIDDELLAKAKITNLPPLQSFRNLILNWQQADANLAATNLVKQIFHQSGLLNYCLNKQDAPLIISRFNAFFDEVKKLNLDNPDLNAQSLLADLALMQKQNLTISDLKTTETNNAITLTTAHSAKGLEWEYVFIYKFIDGIWGNSKKNTLICLPTSIIQHQNLTKKDKEEDERRLFYVALTRAKKSCTITAASTYRQEGVIKETTPSMFIYEIGSNTFTSLQPKVTLPIAIKPKTIENLNQEEKEFLTNLLYDFRLSATALNTYLTCPYKFKLINLLKIPKIKSSQFLLGTAIHAALEFLYKTYASTKTLPSLPSLLQHFDTAFNKEIINQDDRPRYQQKGRDILSRYYQYYQATFKPAAFLEKFFGYGSNTILLDEDIPLVGKIDRLDIISPHEKLAKIIDYKTGKPKSRKQILSPTNKNGYDYYRQLVFYKLLTDLDKRFYLKVVEAELDFVEPDEKGKFFRHSFTITKEDTDNLKQSIRAMMQKLRRLEFPRTLDRSVCKDCEFRDHCFPDGIPNT